MGYDESTLILVPGVIGLLAVTLLFAAFASGALLTGAATADSAEFTYLGIIAIILLFVLVVFTVFVLSTGNRPHHNTRQVSYKQHLVNYTRLAIASGQTHDQVYRDLLQAGWPAELAAEIMREVESGR